MREVRLDRLVGRTVHDVDGRSVGHIHELHAEIELHEHGNEYVVVAFHVGRLALLPSMAASRFAWQSLRFLGRRRYIIPWQLMDLSDPLQPRVRCALEELPSPD